MENDIEINRKSKFSLEEARKLLPVVYRVTDESAREVKVLMNRIDAFAEKNHPSVEGLEGNVNSIIEAWQKKIQMLGGSPKGLWMADFDNGEGYFCWKYPETEINHWHGYQDGYSGRITIE